MEGPSLVIACEDLKPFLKKKILEAEGTAKSPFEKIRNARLVSVRSWGKHLLLGLGQMNLRVHFLMFGSYRINRAHPTRLPKMRLRIGDSDICFFLCAIKVLGDDFEKNYDWSKDLMSPKWDARKALKAIKAKPEAQVCDVLMDQNIFSGLGNIMKNEILYNLKMHPETRVAKISTKRLKDLVRESEAYSWQFYEWKKANVLKRHWQVMRKKKCPNCGGQVTKKPTGILQRFSHFCPKCQKKK